MTTIPLLVIAIVLVAPFIGLLLLIERAWVFLTRRGSGGEAVQSVGKGTRLVVIALAVIILVVLGSGLVMTVMLARNLFGGASYTKSVKVTAPDQDRGYGSFTSCDHRSVTSGLRDVNRLAASVALKKI